MRASRSAYHSYVCGNSYVLSRAKAQLAIQVKEVFGAHRRRYGARRIRAELTAQGVSVGRFQVRSLMRRQNLQAIAARRFRPQTTDSRHTVSVSLNLLLDADNAARKPRQVIVGDITYLPLRSGKWSYLATWQDQFEPSDRGVGGRATDDR